MAFSVTWILPTSFLPSDLLCLLPLTCHTPLASATPASSLFFNTPRVSPARQLCSYCILWKAHHPNILKTSSLTSFKSLLECHHPSEAVLTVLSLPCPRPTVLHIFTCLSLLHGTYNYMSLAHIFVCLLPVLSTRMKVQIRVETLFCSLLCRAQNSPWHTGNEK